MRQLDIGHGLTRSALFIDPTDDLLPADRLPGFERPAVPTETPAHPKVQIARVVGDARQMHAAVMEHVAEHAPHELRLRMRAVAQAFQLCLLYTSDAADDLL